MAAVTMMSLTIGSNPSSPRV